MFAVSNLTLFSIAFNIFYSDVRGEGSGKCHIQRYMRGGDSGGYMRGGDNGGYITFQQHISASAHESFFIFVANAN